MEHVKAMSVIIVGNLLAANILNIFLVIWAYPYDGIFNLWEKKRYVFKFLNIYFINMGLGMPDIIDKTDIFKGLAREQIAKLIKNGQNIKIRPKSILFHQGNPAVKCFMVNRGRLKLTKLNEMGKEVIIRYIDSGELTAAAAVLKNSSYPVSAQSVEDTEVIGWDKQTIIKFMRQYPDIAINLLEIILERIDEVQDRYLEVCTEHVDQRIGRSLLRLMRRAGSETQNGILINIPLSRQNIADYSGTTLYTVSRTLSSWEKKAGSSPDGSKSLSPTPTLWLHLLKTSDRYPV